MPLMIKTTGMKYKDENGQFQGIGAINGGNIEAAVNNWLDENITNPDSPPLDRSLSSSSAAAPADMVGELSNKVESIGDIQVIQDIYAADATNKKILIQKNSEYENVIVPRDFREIGYLKVYRGDIEISKWVYDNSDNSISIANAWDDIRIDVIAHNKKVEKQVDLCLFSGQSNMSGRGDASQSTVCPHGEGYWWHNNTLEDLVDPVGNESASTGTMIPAVCKSYYDTTGIPIVACVYAIGGTSISQWIETGGLVENCIPLVNAAKTYLQTNGYTIGKVMMLWNQGENDAADGTTKADYKDMFDDLCDTLASGAGIEEFFLVNIGQHKQGTTDTSTIRAAQEELADETKEYIMASEKFSGAQSLMADGWHYTQAGLNMVGKDAGINMGYYRMTGVKPLHPAYDFADHIDQNVEEYSAIDLTGWTYTNGTDGPVLNKYNGTAKKVEIQKTVMLNGYIVNASINNNNANLVSVFSGNTSIEEVAIGSDVQFLENGSVHGRYQYMFDGCTSLKKVTSLPDIVVTTDSDMYRKASYMYRGCTNLTDVLFKDGMSDMNQICYGCTSLASVPTFPSTAKNLASAFNGDAIGSTPIIKNLPTIPDSVTNIDLICQYVTTLESIGTIGKGVTTMKNAFRYCESLAGTVRIESSDVSEMTGAFNSSAIPNITFQVPANSTTYTTLTTKFPTATVQTF